MRAKAEITILNILFEASSSKKILHTFSHFRLERSKHFWTYHARLRKNKDGHHPSSWRFCKRAIKIEKIRVYFLFCLLMLRLRAIFAIQPLEIRNVSNHVKNFPFVFGQPFLGYFVFAMITMVEFRRLELWWWGQYTQDHFHIWQQYHPWFLLIPSKPNDQLCCPGATALHEDHRHEFSEFSHFSMCTFTHLAKLVQITVSFSQCLKIFSKGRILRLKLIWKHNHVHVWNTVYPASSLVFKSMDLLIFTPVCWVNKLRN